ncbi:MAG: InlB B-repeat-containing protein [Clostridiales bacterium]|nr:InlB B-repeat-containing protein [Clostridiales bacterium]
MRKKRTNRILICTLMLVLAFMLMAQPVMACCWGSLFCGGTSSGGVYCGSSYAYIPCPKEYVKPYVPSPYKLSINYYPNGGTWLLESTQQPISTISINVEEYVTAIDYNSIDLTVRPPCKVYQTDANRYLTLKPPPGKKFKGWAIYYPLFGEQYWATIGASIKTLQPRYNQYDVYAIWEDDVRYKVTYTPNGGTGSDVTEYGDDDNAVTIKNQNYYRNGYTFAGWNTSPSGNGTSYTVGQRVVLTSNLVLYAQWTADPKPKAKVTYDPNGGIGSVNTVQVQIGNYYTIASQGYTKPDATFNGWNTRPDGTGTSYQNGQIITVNGDITLYAQWKDNKVKCTVTYNPNGGTGSVNTVQVPVNSNHTVIDQGYYRNGYTFKGWNTRPDGTGTSYQNGQIIYVTGDVTLYAQWKLIEYYFAIYDPNGGVGIVYADMADAYGRFTVANKGYYRDGYTFTGYNTMPNGSGISYSIGQTVVITETTFLYAQWKPVAPAKVKVTYDPNGGDGLQRVVEVTINSNYTVASQGYSRANYSFNGWNTRADGTGTAYQNGQIFTVTGDVTLYAQWKKNVCYAVIYYPNGGNGAVAVDTTDINGRVVIADKGYYWNGYTFNGYNTAANGTGFAYAVGQTVTLSDNLILYAQWKPIKDRCTVTYLPGTGGTGGVVDTNLIIGSQYTIKNQFSADVSRPWYNFLYWNTLANGTGTAYLPGQTITLTGDLVLHAYWWTDGR